MLLYPQLVIMNYSLFCNRTFCGLRLRLCNLRKTFYTKHKTYPVRQFGSLLLNFPKEIHMSLQQFSDDSMDEAGEPEDLPLSSSKNIIMEDYSEQFRNTLYPDSDDPIISRLKSCDSIKDLFTTVNENKQLLTPSHCCQVLLVLYDLLHVNNCLFYGTTVSSLPESVEGQLPQDLSSVILNILDFLKNDVDSLTAEELVCCFLYSKRLGTDIKHPSVQAIVMRINNLLLKQDENSFSIAALSRLTIALYSQNELWLKLFLINTIPLIHIHFDKCQTVEEFKALTISMLSTAMYLREELLLDYEVLTEEFLRKGILTREHCSVIVKAVVLLNHVYHYPIARHMTYKLLNMLHGHFHEMFLPHLSELQKVVLRQKEPHDTIMLLTDLKKKSSFLPKYSNQFLHFYVPLMNLPANAKGSQFMKEFIAKSEHLDILLTIQSHLTTAMPDVCHLFWSKVGKILSSVEPGDLKTLSKICYRYLNFSYRMVKYSHRNFESLALSLVAREMVTGTTVMQPKLFALLASFVLTVDSGRGVASLSHDVLTRLLTVVGQLDVQSCLWLSRALGDRMRRSKEVHLLLQVDSALTERTKELLTTEDPGSIRTFNTILRSCINRKQSIESDLMQDAINRWPKFDWSQLTSRTLRNLVYNLHITNALIPPVVERMVDYCLSNSPYIVADTVGKLLHMCYHLGFTPTHIDALCELSADLASRDEEILNGLSILQVALALSFFNRLPASLIQVIFTVDFLERLDSEIKHCFAKDRYPQRVRQTLMELNRSVCLDLPEADVPWFHSKFCEEQKALGQLEAVPKSLLFTDVYSTLLKLVGDNEYIGTRTFSPYGYVLDMELNLDSSLQPVPVKNSKNVQKLALLLNHADSYSVFEQRMKGFHQMKQRHLEILGYRVIGLSDSLWNAMYMTEPRVKLEYLRNLIWTP